MLAETDAKSRVELYEDPVLGVILRGSSSLRTHIASVDDAIKTFQRGKKRAISRSTRANRESSRSHTILTIYIESYTKGKTAGLVKMGKLNLVCVVHQGMCPCPAALSQLIDAQIDGHPSLSVCLQVDLAGSENVKTSGANGMALVEAQHINSALTSLSQVLSALADNKAFVPYRNSKLTFFLKSSLGGNSQTVWMGSVRVHAQGFFNDSTRCCRCLNFGCFYTG